jgi:hypothetical protein
MGGKFLTAAFAVVSLSFAALGQAGAGPAAPLGSLSVGNDIILVEGRCGPGWHRDFAGRCRPNGGPVIVEPPVIVAPPVVVVAPPVVCERGMRWHPRFRRCVVL